jgi:hypothetical protein
VNPDGDPTAAFSDDESRRPLWGPLNRSVSQPTTPRVSEGFAPAEHPPVTPTHSYPAPQPEYPPPGETYQPPVENSTAEGSPRRTGLIVGVAATALLILSSVVLVVTQMHTSSTTGTAPPTNSGGNGRTATSSSMTNSAADQARSISSLLAEAQASRHELSLAITDVNSCQTCPVQLAL